MEETSQIWYQTLDLEHYERFLLKMKEKYGTKGPPAAAEECVPPPAEDSVSSSTTKDSVPPPANDYASTSSQDNPPPQPIEGITVSSSTANDKNLHKSSAVAIAGLPENSASKAEINQDLQFQPDSKTDPTRNSLVSSTTSDISSNAVPPVEKPVKPGSAAPPKKSIEEPENLMVKRSAEQENLRGGNVPGNVKPASMMNKNQKLNDEKSSTKFAKTKKGGAAKQQQVAEPMQLKRAIPVELRHRLPNTKIFGENRSMLTVKQHDIHVATMLNVMIHETGAYKFSKEHDTRKTMLQKEHEIFNAYVKEHARRNPKFLFRYQIRSRTAWPVVKTHFETKARNMIEKLPLKFKRCSEINFDSVIKSTVEPPHLTYEKLLLETSKLPKITKPNVEKRFFIHMNERSLNETDRKQNISIKDDKIVENLIENYAPSFIFSFSSAKTLLTKCANLQSRDWEMPIFVETRFVQGHKKRVCYVLKPLPPSAVSNMQINQHLAKRALKAALIQTDRGRSVHQQQQSEKSVKSATTADSQGMAADPNETGGFETASIDDDDPFGSFTQGTEKFESDDWLIKGRTTSSSITQPTLKDNDDISTKAPPADQDNEDDNVPLKKRKFSATSDHESSDGGGGALLIAESIEPDQAEGSGNNDISSANKNNDISTSINNNNPKPVNKDISTPNNNDVSMNSDISSTTSYNGIQSSHPRRKSAIIADERSKMQLSKPKRKYTRSRTSSSEKAPEENKTKGAPAPTPDSKTKAAFSFKRRPSAKKEPAAVVEIGGGSKKICAEKSQNLPNLDKKLPPSFEPSPKPTTLSAEFDVLGQILGSNRNKAGGSSDPASKTKANLLKQSVTKKMNIIDPDEKPCEFINHYDVPPESHPKLAQYSLWEIGGRRLLLRSNMDGTFKTWFGKLEKMVKATVLPKLEYQWEYGGQKMTVDESLSHWWTAYLKRSFIHLRARINPQIDDGDLLALENLKSNHYLRLENLSLEEQTAVGEGMNRFHRIVEELDSLSEDGWYLLKYEDKQKSYMNIYQAATSNDSCDLDLSATFVRFRLKRSDGFNTPVNFDSVWSPIDPEAVLQWHKIMKRVPATFNPRLDHEKPCLTAEKPPGKKKNKKKKQKAAGKSNKTSLKPPNSSKTGEYTTDDENSLSEHDESEGPCASPELTAMI